MNDVQRAIKQHGALAVTVVIVGIIIATAVYFSPANRKARAARKDCIENLQAFDAALKAHIEAGSKAYPGRLSALSSNEVSPAMFVCPGDTVPEIADSLRKAEGTTSYVYAGGYTSETPVDMPVLICPAANHRGTAHVLFMDHQVRALAGDEMDEVLRKLYADPNQRVMASERLTRKSVGRYFSQP